MIIIALKLSRLPLSLADPANMHAFEAPHVRHFM